MNSLLIPLHFFDKIDWKYSYFLVQFVSGLSQQQRDDLLHIIYLKEHHRSALKTTINPKKEGHHEFLPHLSNITW